MGEWGLGHARVATDLSWQIERERHARTQAEAARQKMEHVLRVVSHDLRDPLHSLHLNVTLIQRSATAPDEGSAAVLSGMQRLIGRMNDLVTDLLISCKLESGATELDFSDHAPAELLEDVLHMMQPIATEKDVRLRVRAGFAGLPAVRCDGDRVLQVLSNLTGNAVKFTPAGGSVEICAEQRGGEVCFAVTDSGPGIGAEDLERVFDRFWQLPGTRRQGTGLGLSIAREIVRAHGGRIWAESEPGRGSTFRFTLPVEARDPVT